MLAYLLAALVILAEFGLCYAFVLFVGRTP